MTRPIYVNRDEAEALVDVCEATRDGRLWDLAAQLRGQWGMGPQPAEMPKPEVAAPEGPPPVGNLARVTIPARTVVVIKGYPFYVVADTVLESHPKNIEACGLPQSLHPSQEKP